MQHGRRVRPEWNALRRDVLHEEATILRKRRRERALSEAMKREAIKQVSREVVAVWSHATRCGVVAVESAEDLGDAREPTRRLGGSGSRRGGSCRMRSWTARLSILLGLHVSHPSWRTDDTLNRLAHPPIIQSDCMHCE